MVSHDLSGPEPGSFLASQARDFTRVQNPVRFSECIFPGWGSITFRFLKWLGTQSRLRAGVAVPRCPRSWCLPDQVRKTAWSSGVSESAPGKVLRRLRGSPFPPLAHHVCQGLATWIKVSRGGPFSWLPSACGDEPTAFISSKAFHGLPCPARYPLSENDGDDADDGETVRKAGLYWLHVLC